MFSSFRQFVIRKIIRNCVTFLKHLFRSTVINGIIIYGIVAPYKRINAFLSSHEARNLVKGCTYTVSNTSVCLHEYLNNTAIANCNISSSAAGFFANITFNKIEDNFTDELNTPIEWRAVTFDILVLLMPLVVEMVWYLLKKGCAEKDSSSAKKIRQLRAEATKKILLDNAISSDYPFYAIINKCFNSENETKYIKIYRCINELISCCVPSCYIIIGASLLSAIGGYCVNNRRRYNNRILSIANNTLPLMPKSCQNNTYSDLEKAVKKITSSTRTYAIYNFAFHGSYFLFTSVFFVFFHLLDGCVTFDAIREYKFPRYLKNCIKAFEFDGVMNFYLQIYKKIDDNPDNITRAIKLFYNILLLSKFSAESFLQNNCNYAIAYDINDQLGSDVVSVINSYLYSDKEIKNINTIKKVYKCSHKIQAEPALLNHGSINAIYKTRNL